jgi:hypothetical protein
VRTKQHLLVLFVLAGCAQMRGPAPAAGPRAPGAGKAADAQPPATIARFTGERAPGQVMLIDDGRALIESGQSLLSWSGGAELRQMKLPTPKESTLLFPSAGSTFLVAEQAEHGEKLTLWDAKTLAPKREIAKDANRYEFSEDGSAFIYTVCGEEHAKRLRTLLKKPEIEEYEACEYRVHDAATGELRSKLLIPYLGDENGPAMPSLAPNGHFVFLFRHQALEAYDAQTAKRTLRREGGAITQGNVVRSRSFDIDGEGMGGELLHAFPDDTLLISRFGMVELDDLKTGKVLGSNRYPSSVSHALSADRTQVATLLPGLHKVSIWDIKTRKIARVVQWNKAPCENCRLESFDGPSFRIGEDEGSVVVNVDTAAVSPATERMSLQVADDGFRIDTSETGARVTAPSGKVHALPSVSGAHVLAGGLVARENGSVSIVRRDGTLLQVGGGDSDRNLIARRGELGVLDHESGATVFLGTQPPVVGKASTASHLYAESSTHTFAHEHQSNDLVARDTAGKEVMREHVASYIRSMTADGPHVAYDGNSVVVCTVGASPCKDFAGTKRVLGLSWPYLLLGELPPVLQSAVLVHLETDVSTPVAVPPDYSPIALLTAKNVAPQIVFVGLSEHRLKVQEINGRALWEAQLPGENRWSGHDVLAMARQGTKLLMDNPFVHSESLLLDATQAGLSTVLFGTRGALEIRADGSARTYGDRTALAGVAFCEFPGSKLNETTLRPLDACVPK